jgi:hypothetical protein
MSVLPAILSHSMTSVPLVSAVATTVTYAEGKPSLGYTLLLRIVEAVDFYAPALLLFLPLIAALVSLHRAMTPTARLHRFLLKVLYVGTVSLCVLASLVCLGFAISCAGAVSLTHPDWRAFSLMVQLECATVQYLLAGSMALLLVLIPQARAHPAMVTACVRLCVVTTLPLLLGVALVNAWHTAEESQRLALGLLQSTFRPCLLAAVVWFAVDLVLACRRHARTFPRFPLCLVVCHLAGILLLVFLLFHAWRCCDWTRG